MFPSIPIIQLIILSLLSTSIGSSVQALAVEKRQNHVSVPSDNAEFLAPEHGEQIWSQRPFKIDVTSTYSTWLFAAVLAIMYNRTNIMHFQHNGNLTALPLASNATTKIYYSNFQLFEHTTRYQENMPYLYWSVYNQNWWPAVIQEAVAVQQDGDWVQNGYYIPDNQTTADAATGLWKISGKPASVIRNPDRQTVLDWLKKSLTTPLVMRLNSNSQFYHVNALMIGENDVSEIKFFAPNSYIDIKYTSLDDVWWDIDQIGHLDNDLGYSSSFWIDEIDTTQTNPLGVFGGPHP